MNLMQIYMFTNTEKKFQIELYLLKICNDMYIL